MYHRRYISTTLSQYIYRDKLHPNIVSSMLSIVFLGKKTPGTLPRDLSPDILFLGIFSWEDEISPRQLSHRPKITPTKKTTLTCKLNCHNEIVSPSTLHHQESSHNYTTSLFKKMERWHNGIGGRPANTRDNIGQLPHTLKDDRHWHAGRKSRRLKHIW